MVIYIKAGGFLREKLNPDVDYYTKKIEIESLTTLREILKKIMVPPEYVAFAYVNNEVKRLDYIPSDGDIITLQPPVAGG